MICLYIYRNLLYSIEGSSLNGLLCQTLQEHERATLVSMQMAQERLHSTFKMGRVVFAKQMIRELVDRRNLCYCLVSHHVFFTLIMLLCIVHLYLDMTFINSNGPKIFIKDLEQGGKLF